MQFKLGRLVSLCGVMCTALLFAGIAQQTTAAQPAQGRGGQNAGQGREGRGELIREFLGLGRAPDPAVAARGEKRYAASCAFCHGTDARGGDGPNLVRAEIVLHDDAGELIGPVLLKGRLDAGMPAFPSLMPEQITEIAEFLHMQVEKAANRGLYGTVFGDRDILTGDARAGEAYFNGAGGCKACHAPTGDLAHVGSKYQPTNLQNRWLWPGGAGRGGGGRGGASTPVKVTISLPSGETVSGTVKRLDDFDVAIIDGNGNYRSWSREGIKVEMPDPLDAHRRLLDRYSDTDVHNVTAYLATLK